MPTKTLKRAIRSAAPLLFIGAVFLFIAPAHAQNAYYNDTVRNYSGQAVQNTPITVCAFGASGIPCSPALQRTNTDALGNYQIIITPGTYLICAGNSTSPFNARCWNQSIGVGGSSGGGTEIDVCQMNFGSKNGGAMATADIQPQPLLCNIAQAGTITDVRVGVDSGASTAQIGYLHSGSLTAVTGVLTPATVAGIPYPFACANTAGTSDTIAGVSVPCGTLTNTAATAGDLFQTMGGAADGTSVLMSVGVFYTQPGGSGGGGSSGVTSLNSLQGGLNLVAGANVTVTPSGTNITIADTPPASATVIGTSGGSVWQSTSAATLTAFLNIFSASLKGLVPPSAGGTVNFLRADGSWATPSGTLGGMTAGQLALANGATSINASRAIVGTDTGILSAGTVTGTGVLLCTTANQGATTSGCGLGSIGGPALDVAKGTATLGTSAIASAACASTVTVSATGVLTSDVLNASAVGNISAVTGYVPSTSGILTVYTWSGAGSVNFLVCNSTASTVTPGAVTLNWSVTR